MHVPRMTPQTRQVLDAMLHHPEGCYGWQLSIITKIPTGTVQPLLQRLEEAGWLTSWWEGPERGGPRRHIFQLSHESEQLAVAAANGVPESRIKELAVNP